MTRVTKAVIRRQSCVGGRLSHMPGIINPALQISRARRRADPSQARSLRYIDLSDTAWDKRGMEHLAQALSESAAAAAVPAGVESEKGPSSAPPAATFSMHGIERGKEQEQAVTKHGSEDPPSPAAEPQVIVVDAYGSFLPPAPLLRSSEDSGRPAAVQTLRMDGCNLRHNVLEVLGTYIAPVPFHLSLSTAAEVMIGARRILSFSRAARVRDRCRAGHDPTQGSGVPG